MRRRDFIAALGGAVAVRPLTAQAQQERTKMLRVGRIAFRAYFFDYWTDAFSKRMAELGYVQGKTVMYEDVSLPYPVAASEYERALRELVRRKVDVIYLFVVERSLRTAVATVDKVPLVLAMVNADPVALGLARSYRESGNNFTGVYFVAAEFTGKRLQLLKEAVPALKALTAFWDRLSEKQWRDAQPAAATLGLELFGVEFKKPPYDFERGFASVPEKYRGGLLVLGSPQFSVPNRRRITGFALRHSLPTMFEVRTLVAEGGLMSYGINLPAMASRAADYVDLIAKGTDPATLPIAQPPKYDFAVNLKTAKTLGLQLPRSILLRATEVIE